MEINSGEIISGCEIIEKIGQGGMGSVFKAYDPNLNRTVAIKILDNLTSNHQDSKERFKREASTVAKCNHPSIVQIYSFGEFNNAPCFVMEYVDGRPLNSFISMAQTIIKCSQQEINDLIETGYINVNNKDTPYFVRDHCFDPRKDEKYIQKVSSLISNVADSLYQAHKMEIIHRDIKPSNIVVTKTGGIKLLDFGLSRSVLDKDITGTHQIMGSLNYMSPEQFKGKSGNINYLTDLYSLGIIFYELITLTHPINKEEVPGIINQIINSKIDNPQKHNKNIPNNLAKLILKMLEKDPNNRFPNAQTFADEIRLCKLPQKRNNRFFSKITSFFKEHLIQEKKSNHLPYKVSPVQRYQQKTNHKQKSNNDIKFDYNKTISDEDKYLAKELFKSAHDDFFINFNFISASEKLQEALELDPYEIDYAIFSPQVFLTFGDIRKALEVCHHIKTIKHKLNQVDQLKAQILIIQYLEENAKKAFLLLQKLNKEIPNYFYFKLLEIQYYIAVGKVDLAILNIEKLIVKYPNYNCFYLILSEIYLIDICDIEKANKILEERIEKMPEVSNLYLVLMIDLLKCNKDKQVIKYLSTFEKLDPCNFFITFIHNHLLVKDKKYKEAIGQARKGISISPTDSLKSEYYLQIYRLYYKLEQFKEADKYLKIAKNLYPENNYQTYDEKKSKYSNMDFSRIKFDSLSEDEHIFFKNQIIKSNCKTLDIDISLYLKDKNYTLFYYFHISETFEHKVIYFRTIPFPSHSSKTKFLLNFPHIPFAPIVDNFGNNLKSEYKNYKTKYGNKIMAEISLSKPKKTGDIIYTYTEFDPSVFISEKDNKKELKTNFPPVMSRLYHTYIVSTAKDLSLTTTSDNNYLLQETDDRKYYIFEKFPYVSESFNIDVCFEK